MGETGSEDTGKGSSCLNWGVSGFPLSFDPFSSLPLVDFCSKVNPASPVLGSRWSGSFRSILGRVGMGRTPAPKSIEGGVGGFFSFFSSSFGLMKLYALQHPSEGMGGGSL